MKFISIASLLVVAASSVFAQDAGTPGSAEVDGTPSVAGASSLALDTLVPSPSVPLAGEAPLSSLSAAASDATAAIGGLSSIVPPVGSLASSALTGGVPSAASSIRGAVDSAIASTRP